MQPCANNRGGAARGPTDKGRSSQPNVLTIKRDRVTGRDGVTGINFKGTPYNDILKQLISELESKKFSSFSHSAAAALLYHCGRSTCTRFPEGLIPLVVRYISFSNDDNGAKAIGNAGYGLQNLDGFQRSTRDLVAALAEKVGASRATLNAQAIGNAVYGLQNLDGSHASTHALVAALADKVSKSGAMLSAQEIGNAVYGLKNLDGAHTSTHALVAALAAKVRESGATLEAQHIGNAVYGLQNLDGSRGSTRDLVAALAVKVRDSGATLDAQAIGNAVYGLQNLDGAHETTHALVAALSSRITGNATCSWGDISGRIVGVSNGDVDTWVAHAELIACACRNPDLFGEPLGVESLVKRLIDTERLYHNFEIHLDANKTGDNYLDFVTLDLHQHVPGSIAPYLDFVLNHDDCFSGWDSYVLVVGKGLHSQHRESELKEAVTSFFQGSTWNVERDPRNSGRMRVSRGAA